MIETQPSHERIVERQRARTIIGVVAGFVFVAFALVAGVKAFGTAASSPGELPATAALSTGAPLASAPVSAEALSQAFANVAKAVGPTVVHIEVKQEVSGLSFHRFGLGFPEQGPRKVPASGSGFVVNPNGYILTNNHVVGKASQIDVKLADGRRFKGTLVGADPATDIAVVKIEATGLPAATLGDSDALQQGDWVVAVGSPFGLEQTITAGIVSAIGRRINGASPYDSFIQTDASINVGNSGGPLVNLRGEVIGINTMIFTETGGNMGIGFAIPSSMSRKIYGQLVANGKVTRGWLGVVISDLTPPLAESLGLPADAKGAVVSDVQDDSVPAAKAGIKAGDVVIAVDGKSMNSSRELTDTVADIAPGTSVQITILRDGKQQNVSVTLGERPANLGLANAEEAPEPESDGKSRERLGITVTDVTPEIAAQLRLKINSGAVVTGVSPGSAAATAGLQRGDVIHRVGRTAVNSTADLAAALSSAESGQQIALQVERRGQLTFLTVTLD
jgi:serine protease Do